MADSSARLLCFPTEDNLKNTHQLKQLLLKALTLTVDAAESYAKVTECSSLALGLGFFPPLMAAGPSKCRGRGSTGAERVSTVVHMGDSSNPVFLSLCLPALLSPRTRVCGRPSTVTGSPS